MPRKTRRLIKVLCDFPPDADEVDVASYVWDALQEYGGSLSADDAMFDCLDVHKVEIGNIIMKP